MSRPDKTTSSRPEPLGRRERLGGFWHRHRTAFWTLHSIWALAAGIAVLFLAHERYGFVPWVVGFLLLTWATTLMLSRGIMEDRPSASPGLTGEVVSYLTRTMYQETLFFILPFYWYSTVIESANVFFSGVLAVLAVFSCIDLVFDRWLRTRPMFGLVFFATVAFAAVNLVLPLLLEIDPVLGTPLAGALSIGSAVPITIRGTGFGGWKWLGVVAVAAAFLGLVIGTPAVVPPVPLRMTSVTFAADIDRSTLATRNALDSEVGRNDVEGGIFVVVEVFAPTNLGTTVSLEWRLDGELVRTSREISIVAHELGFRIWDAYKPRNAPVETGRYRVTLRTPGDRVFGIAQLDVVAPADARPR